MITLGQVVINLNLSQISDTYLEVNVNQKGKVNLYADQSSISDHHDNDLDLGHVPIIIGHSMIKVSSRDDFVMDHVTDNQNLGHIRNDPLLSKDSRKKQI